MNQVYIQFLIFISSCATCFRVALCTDLVASLPVECWDLDPLLATETIAIYQQDWDFNDVVGILMRSPEDVKDLWKNEIGSSWHKEASTWGFLVGGPWTTLFVWFSAPSQGLTKFCRASSSPTWSWRQRSLGSDWKHFSLCTIKNAPQKKTAPVCQTDSSTLYSHYKIYKCLVDDVLNGLRPIHTWNSRMILDNFPNVPGLFFWTRKCCCQ